MSATTSMLTSTPLDDVTFVVVDLETTGGSPRTATITEIGAVKLRGGRTEEFQELVNPGMPIPPFIVGLTGITDDMVARARPLDTVLADFLDFVGDAVLVAHNAPFDIGFLRHFARCLLGPQQWRNNDVVDTWPLARRTLERGETVNHKLATLAAHVGSATRPEHRALGDARATVDVLRHLLDRQAERGVTTLEQLLDLLS